MVDAAGFDAWYANIAVSPRRDAVHREGLGLPPELESTSLLSWDGIADVTAALRLRPGDRLLDLGCGRGGYGLEVAARTGASLVGVDFSPVAVERARAKAAGRAEFRVGELTGTGLPAASFDAVLCVDAMQFAEPYAAGIAECRRLLAPGGRLVLTGWEAADGGEVPRRLRHDIAAELRAAGFADVGVRHMPGWHETERELWRLALATDPDGDPAIAAMRDEAERVSGWIDRVRRVLATGRVDQRPG